jgi:hypothetical protein
MERLKSYIVKMSNKEYHGANIKVKQQLEGLINEYKESEIIENYYELFALFH